MLSVSATKKVTFSEHTKNHGWLCHPTIAAIIVAQNYLKFPIGPLKVVVLVVPKNLRSVQYTKILLFYTIYLL